MNINKRLVESFPLSVITPLCDQMAVLNHLISIIPHFCTTSGDVRALLTDYYYII